MVSVIVLALVYDANGTHFVVKWVLARCPEDPFGTQTGPRLLQPIKKAAASSTAMHENCVSLEHLIPGSCGTPHVQTRVESSHRSQDY